MKNYFKIGAMAVLGLLLATSVAIGDPQTNKLLEKELNTSNRTVTWNNATGITALYSSSYAATATLAVSTSEVFTTASSYGAAETILTASVTGAQTATIVWNTSVLTIDCAGAPASVGTQGVATCTGNISIGACDALIQDLDCIKDAGSTITVAWSSPYSAVGYSNYGDATAIIANQASATLDSATPYTVATTAAAAHDSALLDCTGYTLAECETAFESMWEGDVNTMTITDGHKLDLDNAFDDVANLGATTYAAALAIPMTAGGAAIDYLEEDKFKSITHITADCNFTTACEVRVYDLDYSTTVPILVEPLADDIVERVSGFGVIQASGSQGLLVQIYSGDTIAVVTRLMVTGTLK